MLGPATAPSRLIGPTRARHRTRRRVWILIAIVVLGWSIVELVSLLSRHTTGPELYGVVVAGLAVAAGVLNLALLRSEQRRLWATVAVLILWGVVALGGLAGTVAHIIGPVPATVRSTCARGPSRRR